MPLNPNINPFGVSSLARGAKLKAAVALVKDLAALRPTIRNVVGALHDGLAGGDAGTRPSITDRLPGLRGSWPSLDAVAGLPGMPKRHEAAVPPVADGASFVEHRFTNAFGSRTYKLYRPARTEAHPMPLVVMLHGCQQSPGDFAAGTRMNELAEEHGFLVAYPGQPSSANPSRCWNWFNATDQARDAGEPSLIAGITREIIARDNADPARIYVAGLSAGGAQAAILGATYPDLYAAVGVHSGLACGAAKDVQSAFSAMRQGAAFVLPGAGRPVPTIVFHGDGDNTVHPVNGDQVITQAKAAARLDATTTKGRSAGGVVYTRTMQADAGGRPMLEHWVLHGAGHAWSGGSPAGSYTAPHGPDASREMLRFFQDQARPFAPVT